MNNNYLAYVFSRELTRNNLNAHQLLVKDNGYTKNIIWC